MLNERWAWHCGTAFMRYLRVRVETLRINGPDLGQNGVIPCSESSGEPGINRAARESGL
jgi:hypothetical protein